MPSQHECLIDAELALALQDVIDARNLGVSRDDHGFRCPGCRRPVRPHKVGLTVEFEHLDPNPNCSADVQ